MVDKKVCYSHKQTFWKQVKGVNSNKGIFAAAKCTALHLAIKILNSTYNILSGNKRPTEYVVLIWINRN